MLEDTAHDHPFRERMVIDWWSRVVDPLEAEEYDEMRLRYFRKRLAEHKRSASHNARVRQGEHGGKELRRLTPLRLAYVSHQVRRLGDRKLNYAAVDHVYGNNDAVFRRLAIGLLDMEKLHPGPKGFIFNVVRRMIQDARFQPLREQVIADVGRHLPRRTENWVQERLALIDQPFDLLPPQEDTYLEQERRAGLIRKLEEKYLNKLNKL